MRKVMAWFVPAGPATPMAARAGWAAMLGIWCGFVAGLNLPCWVLVALACCLRVPLRLFAVAMCGGWAGSVLAAPYSARFGQWLLHEGGLAERLAPYVDSWIVPLLAADRYSQWGGLVLGLAAGVAAGDAMARAWRQLHRRQSPDHSARFFPGVRWQGCAAAVALSLLAAVAGWIAAPRYLERELLRTLSEWTGAEVKASAVQIGLADGRVLIEDLRVIDAADATRERVRVGRAEGRCSPVAAWGGRWHVKRVRLQAVTCAEEPEAELPTSIAADAAVDRNATWACEGYLRDPEAARQWGRLAWEVVAQLQRLSGLEDGTTNVDGAWFERCWAERTRRCELEPTRGRVEIGEVDVEGLPESWGLGSDATLELAHLSSRPAPNSPPTVISGTAPQAEAVWQIQLAQRAVAEPQRISVVARHVPCEVVADLAALDPVVRVHQGQLNLEARGTFDATSLDLAIEVETEQLGAELRTDRAVAGRSVDAWNRCLHRTPELTLAARWHGAWPALRLECDPHESVEAVRMALEAQGEETLLAEFDMAPSSEPPAMQVADAGPEAPATHTEEKATDSPAAGAADVATARDVPSNEAPFRDEQAEEGPNVVEDDTPRDATLAATGAITSRGTQSSEAVGESTPREEETTAAEETPVVARPSHDRQVGADGFRRLRESEPRTGEEDGTEENAVATASPRSSKGPRGGAPKNVVAAVPLDDPLPPMTAERSHLSTPWGAAMPGRSPAATSERPLAQQAAPPQAIAMETGYDYRRAPVPPTEVVADYRRRAAALAAQERQESSAAGLPPSEPAHPPVPVPQMARATRRSPVQAVPLNAEPAGDAPFPIAAGRRGSNLGPGPGYMPGGPSGAPAGGPLSRTAGRPAADGTRLR